MHAVIDTERKERNAAVEAVKQTQDKGLVGVGNELRHSYLLGSVTEMRNQHGVALPVNNFMAKLRVLNQDLICLPHPTQPKFCNLYLSMPAGEPLHLMPMETWMPEWSVMDTEEVRKPSGDFQSFWESAKTIGSEKRRGWRTVLARLIQKGLIGLEATEREFGSADRLSWAALTGKTADAPLI